MLRITLLFLSYLCFPALFSSTPEILTSAHSHNDYLRSTPLKKALKAGFWSVEADVSLRKGKLVVSHTRLGAIRNRCFESIYLKPLAERVQKNDGVVYPHGPNGFVLMIDVKFETTETFDSIYHLLLDYQWMLTEYREGSVIEKAVTVLISGRRDQQRILATNPRLTAIDGRRQHLDSELPTSVIPRISMPYKSVLSWRGIGQMPEEQSRILTELVEKANAGGHELRFWGATNRRAVWEELLNHGVHIINVDRIKRFKRFKKSYNKE